MKIDIGKSLYSDISIHAFAKISDAMLLGVDYEILDRIDAGAPGDYQAVINEEAADAFG